MKNESKALCFNRQIVEEIFPSIVANFDENVIIKEVNANYDNGSMYFKVLSKTDEVCIPFFNHDLAEIDIKQSSVTSEMPNSQIVDGNKLHILMQNQDKHTICVVYSPKNKKIKGTLVTLDFEIYKK